MMRIKFAVVVLIGMLLLPWPQAVAQGPTVQPAEQIDDLTPLAVELQGKRDTSDEQRVPDAYLWASGGPDRLGYTYTDSDGGACTFDWIEVPGSGLVVAGDEATASLPIGFAFPFYGTVYDEITIDSNGVLIFQANAPSAWENRPLGDAGPSPRLAPFWDDLQVGAVHHALLGTAPERTLLVTFDARRGEAGPLRFQVLLGEDGQIRFQYQRLDGERSDGGSASVGIQGPATGLGYLFNGYPAGNRLRDGLAVCFVPPAGLYLSPGVQGGYAEANGEVSFRLWAGNRSGAEGTFDLGVESAWPATVMPQRLVLAEGQVRPVTVRVRVPAGAPGERAAATVRLAGPAGEASAAVEVGRSSGAYGYTGASTSDEAAIFDLQTASLVDRLDLLPEGNYPYDATMRPDGSEVWIPGASGDGLVIIDTATNTITHRISGGEYPVSVAFRDDSAYAFVANRDTEDVTVVDTASYAVVDTIPIPTHYLGAGNLALNPESGDMYVVDWYGDYFWALDTDTFTVTQEILQGSSLWQLVVSPLGDRLYITDRGLDVVHVVDTADLSTITAISVGDDPWGIDITPDGSLIYVTNEDSHDVTVIDATTNGVVTTVALPHGTDSDPRDVDFSADGAYAYVTSGSVTGDDEVYVLETTTHTVADRISVAPAGNPNVVAVAPQMADSLGLLADKTATPEPVVLGDPLTYTISFNYTGLVSATQVLVTDTLPAGTDYLTSSGGLSSTYDMANHRVIWDLGDVPAFASGELVALVQPVDWALAGQVITNEAYLDFTSFGNFSATVQAASMVQRPELNIRYPEGGDPPDPLLLCDGQEVILAAESNRPGPLTYAWDLGDGTLASTALVTHQWSYGDYSLALSTTNAYGWVETDTLSVEVGHVPAAGFLSNSPIVLGQNATFTDTTAYDPATWTWDFGDGVGTSNQPNPAYNYSNAGDYTVTLSVTNRCGVDVYQALFRVEEAEPPLHYFYLPVVTKSYP
ncbi:MAG: PKD domain-containing protein [Anaerolineae bacterium]